MKFLKDRNVWISLALSGLVALIVVILMEFGMPAITFINELVTLPETIIFWQKAAILILLAVLVGFLTERLSVKRLLPYVAGFFINLVLREHFVEIFF